MAFPLPVGQQTTATFLESDSTFNPFPVKGPISWSLSTEGIATLTVAIDTKTATITGVAAGEVTLAASGDGVSTAVDIVVTGSAAAASIDLSTPITPA